MSLLGLSSHTRCKIGRIYSRYLYNTGEKGMYGTFKHNIAWKSQLCLPWSDVIAWYDVYSVLHTEIRIS